MSAEQLSGNTPENNSEKELSPEHLEKHAEIGAKLEKAAEKGVESGEKTEARARTEALEKAISVEAGSAEKKSKAPKAPTRHGVVSKNVKKESYQKHLATLQAELPPAQRAFSKVIHNPIIEKTSDMVGSSVARPNAILAGAVVAFFAVLAVYLTAKHFGYALSGFETIGAFVVGWVLGMLYDFFKVMITGKKA